MNQEELRKYIRKKLKAGYPAGELENELLARGISKEAIRDTMNNPKYQWDVSSTRKNMLAINGACLLFVALSMVVSGMNPVISGVTGLIAISVMLAAIFRQKTKNGT
jgi:hypothetical protein